MEKKERILLEESLAAELAHIHLPKEQFLEWQAASHTFVASCQFNKFFVIWKRDGDKAEVLDHLKITDVQCGTDSGFSMLIQRNNGDAKWVTHRPCKLWEYPIYMHMPHIMTTSFLHKAGSQYKVFQFPVVLKVGPALYNTESEGPFITDLSKFRATHAEHRQLVLN